MVEQKHASRLWNVLFRKTAIQEKLHWIVFHKDLQINVLNVTEGPYTAPQYAAESSIELNGPPQHSEVWYFLIMITEN